MKINTLNRSEHIIKNHQTSKTFINLLRNHTEFKPEQKLFFLENGEDIKKVYTYQMILDSVYSIAAKLQQLKMSGKNIMIMCTSSYDYILAYFGCIFAGSVAVTAYPPWKKHVITRFKTIIKDADIDLIISTKSIFEGLSDVFINDEQVSNISLLPLDEIDSSLSDKWVDPNITENDIAFLQYTSGSTSDPKGVMVTHNNLLHISQLLYDGFITDDDTVGLTWLPPHHDMGLIGCILQAFYACVPLYIMTPMRFMQKPLRWLNNISKYKITITGGPNFAYDYLVEKYNEEKCRNLDLSSLQSMTSGSEPVRKLTLVNFVETYRKHGLRSEVLLPCYGLAEATLFVSGLDVEKEPHYYYADKSQLENN